MLDPTVLTLASSGATALVTAAGTDAWSGLRTAFVRWVARGGPQAEGEAEDRLDHTANVLRAAAAEELGRVRLQEEAVWRDRIETALRALDETQRAEAVEGLGKLLAEFAGTATARPASVEIGGDVSVRTGHSSIAIGVISGGQPQIGTPRKPDPAQG
ncbi:hypothetical protein [Streptomyces cinerochromogenes]|uniref:hypothetical protein n=1 Tax=Streptomyces cinerochromogenes TaxID=66422 RepID=UPI0033A706D1